MLKLWTAQYRYPGPHRLDITVKGNNPIGRIFAPNWKMVNDWKASGNEQTYIKAYHELMLTSYYSWNEKWKELLQQKQVVLVCFCKAGTFCHRNLLAQYLVQLGAEYQGEITDFSPWKTITTISSVKTLMQKAKALGDAKKSGDINLIKKAQEEHDQYRDICLKSDKMFI